MLPKNNYTSYGVTGILMHSLGDVWHPGSGVPCVGGFASFAAFGGSQSHFLPYHNAFLIGDVWHPGSGVPCLGGFGSFANFGGSQSHSLPYLDAFLRWRLASWLRGSLFRRFWRFCSLWGLTVSLASIFFPILMHSLGLASWLWGSLFRKFCKFRSLCWAKVKEVKKWQDDFWENYIGMKSVIY